MARDRALPSKSRRTATLFIRPCKATAVLATRRAFRWLAVGESGVSVRSRTARTRGHELHEDQRDNKAARKPVSTSKAFRAPGSATGANKTWAGRPSRETPLSPTAGARGPRRVAKTAVALHGWMNSVAVRRLFDAPPRFRPTT